MKASLSKTALCRLLRDCRCEAEFERIFDENGYVYSKARLETNREWFRYYSNRLMFSGDIHQLSLFCGISENDFDKAPCEREKWFAIAFFLRLSINKLNLLMIRYGRIPPISRRFDEDKIFLDLMKSMKTSKETFEEIFEDVCLERGITRRHVLITKAIEQGMPYKNVVNMLQMEKKPPLSPYVRNEAILFTDYRLKGNTNDN